jgi:regulator of protease activity HflC (stomatin/prohibitin superfamily)
MTKADYLSYRKARNVSALGLVLQLIMAVGLAIYGGLAGNHFGMSGAFFVACGVPVWLLLILVFDQHTRERIEAIEAEQLEQSGTIGASVFQESASDLRVAAKRLAFVQRVVVPIWTLAVAGLLAGLGVWRYSTVGPFLARVAETRGTDVAIFERLAGWGTAVGLGVAFVGFIFARFVSGMAKQQVWTYLRAGAAYAVSAALVGLGIAVALFVDKAGPDTVLRVLVRAIPIAMMVLAAETIVAFLLELYRPRRAGEGPRLALDSLLLRFVAAPDRFVRSIGEALDYQLGFNVQRGWMYQLLSRSFWRLVILTAVIVWLLSAVTVVQPHQRGMVLRFGQVVKGDVGPGLHLKLPWPIDTLEIPEFEVRDATGKVTARGRTATGVRRLTLGTPEPQGDGPILWTNEHVLQEQYTIVQPSRSAQSMGDGGKRDVALIAAEIPLHYVVRDVEKFDRFAAPSSRDALLRAIGQREAMRYLSSLTVDDMLGAKRKEISERLREAISRAFEEIDAGVEVTFVAVESVHPPRSVAPNYERIVQAEQKTQAMLETARAAAITSLTEVVGSVELADEIDLELTRLSRMESGATPEEIAEQEDLIERLLDRAGGNAASMIQAASAERWKKHMGERSRATRYEGQLRMYRAAPSVYQAGLYFDAIRDSMRNARVFITSPDVFVRAEVQTVDTGVGVFNPGEEEDAE